MDDNNTPASSSSLAQPPQPPREESKPKENGNDDDDDGMRSILAAAIGLSSLGAPGTSPAVGCGQQESVVAPSKDEDKADGVGVGTIAAAAEDDELMAPPRLPKAMTFSELAT
eukprot:CAMPEP_0172324404 /NCGR_PEP_ID=MMETSP1058-20130122/51301_1 /TAXON_ID=83371 /ORGANISM="Detonula confervacea, Strain CCMP 353" /LENGTH=112 /DNA_ID=CAMNT_0013040673 /DNA_START=17 /DNA_END=351 /DNA_ORIENTATION=+